MARQKMDFVQGVDPFRILAELAASEDNAMKLAASRELCKYLEPQKKSVEHDDKRENPYDTMPLEKLRIVGKEKLGI